MKKNRSFLNPGGFAAALTCLVLAACGGPGSMDSGMPMSDAGPMMGDGGPDQPDAYMVPDSDSGMPDVDAGTDASDGGGTCTTGCTTQPDLPPGMTYVDTAMIPGCMTTLDGTHSWGGPSFHGCIPGGIFRESGSNQWLLNFGCGGYGGLLRLGSDGHWYGGRDHATTEESAEYPPNGDCTRIDGMLYHPDGTMTPFPTWVE